MLTILCCQVVIKQSITRVMQSNVPSPQITSTQISFDQPQQIPMLPTNETQTLSQESFSVSILIISFSIIFMCNRKILILLVGIFYKILLLVKNKQNLLFTISTIKPFIFKLKFMRPKKN